MVRRPKNKNYGNPFPDYLKHNLNLKNGISERLDWRHPATLSYCSTSFANKMPNNFDIVNAA